MNAKKTGVSDELLKLLENEIKISTVFGLYLFETLNLKYIAKIINKNESTTLRHLKALIGDNIIEIDQKMSAESWGKFYRLTKPFKLNLEQMFPDAPIKWDDTNSYDKLASGVRSISSLMNAVGKFTASYLVSKSQNIENDREDSEDNISMSRFSIALSLPSIKSKEDVKELKNIIREFNEKIDKLDRKYSSKPLNNQIVYLFTAPLDEIHPLKK